MTAALKDFFAESKSKDALVALGQALSDVAGAAGGVLLAALRTIRLDRGAAAGRNPGGAGGREAAGQRLS
jgi:hypothetical protein